MPPTDGLVVFAGKTLELLSNGLYPAVLHRVQPGRCGTRAGGRLSLAFKLRAPADAEVKLGGEVTTVGEL